MSHRNLARRSRPLTTVIAYVSLALVAAIALLPLVWVFGISLKTRLETLSPSPQFIWWPTFENYLQVLHRADFFNAFRNSLVVSIGAVAVCMCAGVPAAYAFARFSFPGSRVLFFSLLIMRMLPPIAVLLPMFVLFSKIGITNSHLSLILAYTTFSLPLVVWIMRGFIEELPRELEESGLMDGAGHWIVLRLIVLPLIRPGLVAVAIISLVMGWNDFMFAAVLTDNATQTLPVLMASYSGDTGIDWGPMAASGIMVVLPVFVLALLVQRHLVAGLSAGAIRG